LKRFLRGISFYILIIIIIYMFVLIIQNAEPVKEKLSYTQLITDRRRKDKGSHGVGQQRDVDCQRKNDKHQTL